MNRGSFKRGNKLGGNHGGAGRPPDWFKQECARILAQPEVLKFLKDVAAGRPIKRHKKVGKQTVHWEEVPEVRDQQKAIESLSDRAFGRPDQAVQFPGGLDVKINMVPATGNARDNGTKD